MTYWAIFIGGVLIGTFLGMGLMVMLTFSGEQSDREDKLQDETAHWKKIQKEMGYHHEIQG